MDLGGEVVYEIEFELVDEEFRIPWFSEVTADLGTSAGVHGFRLYREYDVETNRYKLVFVFDNLTGCREFLESETVSENLSALEQRSDGLTATLWGPLIEGSAKRDFPQTSDVS